MSGGRANAAQEGEPLAGKRTTRSKGNTEAPPFVKTWEAFRDAIAQDIPSPTKPYQLKDALTTTLANEVWLWYSRLNLKFNIETYDGPCDPFRKYTDPGTPFDVLVDSRKMLQDPDVLNSTRCMGILENGAEHYLTLCTIFTIRSTLDTLIAAYLELGRKDLCYRGTPVTDFARSTFDVARVRMQPLTEGPLPAGDIWERGGQRKENGTFMFTAKGSQPVRQYTHGRRALTPWDPACTAPRPPAENARSLQPQRDLTTLLQVTDAVDVPLEGQAMYAFTNLKNRADTSSAAVMDPAENALPPLYAVEPPYALETLDRASVAVRRASELADSALARSVDATLLEAGRDLRLAIADNVQYALAGIHLLRRAQGDACAFKPTDVAAVTRALQNLQADAKTHAAPPPAPAPPPQPLLPPAAKRHGRDDSDDADSDSDNDTPLGRQRPAKKPAPGPASGQAAAGAPARPAAAQPRPAAAPARPAAEPPTVDLTGL